MITPDTPDTPDTPESSDRSRPARAVVALYSTGFALAHGLALLARLVFVPAAH